MKVKRWFWRQQENDLRFQIEAKERELARLRAQLAVARVRARAAEARPRIPMP